MSIALISWIFFGALAGWITGLVFERDDKTSLSLNIFVGALGALAAGIVYSVVSSSQMDSFTVTGLIISIAGSILILAAMKGFTKA